MFCRGVDKHSGGKRVALVLDAPAPTAGQSQHYTTVNRLPSYILKWDDCSDQVAPPNACKLTIT